MNNPNRPQDVAQSIASNRPAGQIASIARQLEALYSTGQHQMPFEPDRPIGIGISGGRRRLSGDVPHGRHHQPLFL